MSRERLTGITGSMFAGKTAEMLRLVERAEIAGRKVQVFKPSLDDRWGDKNNVRSHSGVEHQAIAVESPDNILNYLEPNTQLVAIDEVQFFDESIIQVVDAILDSGVEVVISGLPLDFRGEPFGPMPILLAKSDNLVKVTAICTYSVNGEICGKEATRTQRIVNGKPANFRDAIVQIGAEESYAARCPAHHEVPGRPEKNVKYK